MKAKRQDFVPENFVGKGGKGYILKNWVVHRGTGAPKVDKNFADAVRLTGTKNEHKLNKHVLQRMKEGGPRFAAMGCSKGK